MTHLMLPNTRISFPRFGLIRYGWRAFGAGVVAASLLLSACGWGVAGGVQGPQAAARHGSLGSTGAEAGVGLAGVAPESVLGSVDGVEIRATDLPSEVTDELRRLENEAEQRKLHVLWRGLEDVIETKLLRQEAGRLGTSVSALLATEVDDALEPISDEEVRKFYDANARYIDAPFEVAMPVLKTRLEAEQRQARRKAFVAKLREGGQVLYTLPVPSLPRFAVESGDGPAKGANDAKVTLVEFSDFECPYCRQASRTIDALVKMYPRDLKVVHRDFPLRRHGNARAAAKAAYCAGEQSQFWGYHDLLFQRSPALQSADLRRYADELSLDGKAFDACLASERPEQAVSSAQEAGRRAGVDGTPAIFVNGIKLVGVLPLPVMQALIDHELQQ